MSDDLVIVVDKATVTRNRSDLIRSVSWQVELDERWVVLGPNGAGKTTLLNLAGARLYPTRGTVTVLGEKLGRTNINELKTRLGFSSAGLQLPADETVRDVVVTASWAVVGRFTERYDRMDESRAQGLLEQFGVGALADRLYGTLSEGERKRVQIARSLMVDPELLLLDEPTAGLDLGAREDLVRRLCGAGRRPGLAGHRAGHAPRRGDPAGVHPRAADARRGHRGAGTAPGTP